MLPAVSGVKPGAPNSAAHQCPRAQSGGCRGRSVLLADRAASFVSLIFLHVVPARPVEVHHIHMPSDDVTCRSMVQLAVNLDLGGWYITQSAGTASDSASSPRQLFG